MAVPIGSQDLANRLSGATLQKKIFSGLQETTTKPSVLRAMLGDRAPQFAELTEKILFDDIWERPDLARRDRSLITVSALIALNRTAQRPFHLAKALENGVTRDELITHLAFNSGWPNSMSAIMLAKNYSPTATALRNCRDGCPQVGDDRWHAGSGSRRALRG